jgi:hypothetical protein
MDVALVDGTFNWRGTYETDPAESFTLPLEWTAFGVVDLDSVPAFTDLTLSRYLGQENTDPFVEDYDAWLAAAQSIEGPETIKLGGGATGDLYVVTLSLGDVPELIAPRIEGLTQGPGALADPGALVERLADDGTVTWLVILDPANGRLVGQEIEGNVDTGLEGDAVAEPYATLSVSYSERQSVLFGNVNQPIEMPDLAS